MLEVDDITTSYGGLKALHGVSIKVEAGEIVAVIGANGAGKSTLLKSIAGLVRPDHGAIRLDGADLGRLPAHKIARAGISLVPEGRRLFPRLKVRDNLTLGAYPHRKDPNRDAPLELIFALFPRLAERLDQLAGTLSGGEQQMLAIGRALMTKPKLLMLDEPSQGIMPRLVDDILDGVKRIRDEGMTVLIVEQRVVECLEIADRAYVLQTGRVTLSGKAADLAGDDAIRRAYLGL
ncbi:MAG TPA: ABC transporter ATP-binding protein [Stellaceae bacterium]|nr:ABC transporter ATP-binding protein [Stellaceae bacterium]